MSINGYRVEYNAYPAGLGGNVGNPRVGIRGLSGFADRQAHLAPIGGVAPTPPPRYLNNDPPPQYSNFAMDAYATAENSNEDQDTNRT